MNEDFKDGARNEHGRQAFWNFGQFLKNCLVKKQLEPVFELWAAFDQNGRNLFINFKDNCLIQLIRQVL